MFCFGLMLPQSALTAHAAPTPETPVSSADWEGALEEGVVIVIHKAKREMLVLVNGVVQRQFQIAVGRNPEATPEGIYRIVTKVVDPWYIPQKIAGGSPRNPLGTRWLGLNVAGTDGYRYGLHGTNQPKSIGQSVSAGCIRMYNADIEWVYHHIPLRTYVQIIK